MDKKLYDDAFYLEQKKWGTWDSYTPEGKCIITSLTEEECINMTRFILKFRQENKHDEVESTYSGEVTGKL